ncbi:MAG TPA: plastocyanin/azurin family copper-binding protein [Blastococcus sp.]|nr:plastocyanin/azurin family copper-binding protein [Blastococcus sp.]
MTAGGRTTTLRSGGTLLGLVVLSGVLTGCSGDDAGAAASPSTAAGVGEVTTGPDGVQEITVQTQDDYVFLPDSFTVDPGKVRLTVVNVAKEMTHNLEFTDDEAPAPIAAGVSLLAPGQEMTIDFEVAEPGDYPFACTFHLQLGQVGTMTVRG